MKWSFYRTDTGELLSRVLSFTREADVAANTPVGCTAIEGEYDFLSQRVDVVTGKVLDWQPPAPDADHEWNASLRRWMKKAAIVEREMRRAATQAQIDALERQQQRRVRELLAESDPRLKAIDQQIEALRPDLT